MTPDTDTVQPLQPVQSTEAPAAAPAAEESAPERRERKFLPLLLGVVSLALGWVLAPFFGAIMWGVIIALLFAPLFRRLLRWTGQRRTAAALLTMLVAILIVVVPFIILSAALAREATQIYERVQSGELNPGLYFRGLFDALPGWITGLLDRFGLVDFETLQRRLAAALAQGSQFIATRSLSIGQFTFEFVAGLFITLYLAFFLIRDGGALARSIRRMVPLAPDHQQELLDKFRTVIRASVKGSLVVAAVQGVMAGLMFWLLGVGGALLLAVLTAFLSLLPAVGAALVWLPIAVYFLVTGALWQGIVLLVYGALVIGSVDNLLRPILVGRDTRMPDYVVMITTLGGMAAFGINGFILGPVIAAMFITAWHIYGSTRR
jgi:predicted PurR-regulated permease PerM